MAGLAALDGVCVAWRYVRFGRSFVHNRVVCFRVRSRAQTTTTLVEHSCTAAQELKADRRLSAVEIGEVDVRCCPCVVLVSPKSRSVAVSWNARRAA